jgi:hypothetical protein
VQAVTEEHFILADIDKMFLFLKYFPLNNYDKILKR